MKRILPDMTRAKAHWIHRGSDIPDYIEIPMSDGRKVRFNPEIEPPGVLRALENIRNMKGMAVGYRWKGEEHEGTV